MKKARLEKIESWFHSYVPSFRGTTPSTYEMIDLKHIHSVKVAELAREIAVHLRWKTAKINTAYALGLLHDIGRFSQFAEFGTFADPLTIDHGERGYEITKKFNILEKCGGNETECILMGIRHHNDYSVPENIPEYTIPFVKLIRDADKLDIYRIMKDLAAHDHTETHLRTALSLETSENPDTKALEEIFSKKIVTFTNIKSQADFTLMKLSWVFDINYRYTLEKIKESGVITLFASLLPDNKDARKAGEFVCECLEEMLSLTPAPSPASRRGESFDR